MTMPDNIQNNPGWRSRLAALDFIPGEIPVDKTARWDKLQQRLEKSKSRKKIFYWYWAAACGLLALVLPWMLLQKNDVSHPIVKETIRIPETKQILVKEILPVTPNPPSVDINSTKASMNVAERKSLPHRLVLSNLEKTIDSTGRSSTTGSLTTITPVTLTDTSMPIALSEIPTRKLKVVHVNEIGGNQEKTNSSFGRFIKTSRKDLTQQNTAGNHVEHILIRKINPQN